MAEINACLEQELRGGMTGKGHKGTFWKDIKVLCLDDGGDDIIVYISQNC